MSAPKKKKGMSLEEKREAMMAIFLEKNEVFTLKELESLGAKAGVVQQTIKDVVQSLVDDNMVQVDKIGSGNFYWVFPSKAYVAAQSRVEALTAALAAEEAAVAEMEARIAAISSSAADAAERTDLLAELTELTKEAGEVKSSIAAFAASDPEALKEIVAKARLAKASCDRWTDNVWTLKSHLVNKYGKMPSEVDAMMAIPDDFDYVP